MMYAILFTVISLPPQAPELVLRQAPPMQERLLLSDVELPKNAVKYEAAKYTQSIAVVNGLDDVRMVPIRRLATKWHQSGGMEEVTGWTSTKYKTVPAATKTWIGNIHVRNSFGHLQPNRGILRQYPDGTRFDDVLSVDGVVFEQRTRIKRKGEWVNSVTYENINARPKGYTGLKVSCVSCHGEAGSGEYGEGLVPGGDQTLSDPLDWSLVNQREPAPSYEWQTHSDGTGWGLYRDGKQIGWYDRVKASWKPFGDAPKELPVSPPTKSMSMMLPTGRPRVSQTCST
jgi:hypothetical protein